MAPPVLTELVMPGLEDYPGKVAPSLTMELVVVAMLQEEPRKVAGRRGGRASLLWGYLVL